MQISKISYAQSINNARRIQTREKVTTNPISNSQVDPSKALSILSYGRELVSFGAKNEKPVQVVNEYFKLPAGCKPDEFQVESGRAISKGHDLIVDAPTGTGKTAIAHYAASKNIKEGKKTFYTTPLKALSNQKYNEFKAVYGDENVGILTGDRRENAEAPILIMTTEVYRNMALSNMYDEPVDLMDNLQTVILDEFHYVGDIDRGSVWEESMMFTPKDVQTVALSATIGNPEELHGWFENIGKKKVDLVNIPSSARHVPLRFDQFKTASFVSEIKRSQNKRTKGNEKQGGKVSSKASLGDYKTVVNKLDQRDQLPAIFFVFSRKFSKSLVDYLSQSGNDLTTKEEKKEIEEIISKYKDKSYIGANLNIAALKKGYAVHNAGIMPEQKAMIEELFQKKLVKVVVATETLAAGINMPAKTVVISNPYKPANGENSEITTRMLSANEFNQMAGRAGRRGIDSVGYVYSMVANKEMENAFNYLQETECENLESRLNPGYSFLAGFYEYNKDDSKLGELYDKSFYTYSSDGSSSDSKKAALIRESAARREVLVKRGFFTETEDGIKAEPKGKMLSVIRGYDPLTIVEAIDSKKFAEITPENLALIAASIANPSRGGEDEIIDTDYSEIFDRADDSIDTLYANQNRYIDSKLKFFDKTSSDFSSYAEILSFLDTVEMPNVDAKEVKESMKQVSQQIRKIRVIQANGGNYSPEALVKAFSRGSAVPTKVLESYLEIISQYKSRNNVSDIGQVIDRIEKEIQGIDASVKGVKAQAKAKKKIDEANQRLQHAKNLKYLDERIFDEIGENYRYIKKHSLDDLNAKYQEYSQIYAKLTAVDTLKQCVQSCIDMDEYKDKHDLSLDSYYNSRKANECIGEIRAKSIDINADEKEVENKHKDVSISGSILRPNKEMANIVYKWAYLNKVQSDSMASWRQVIKGNEEDGLDEGSIYRAVLQTNDLLCQFAEIAEKGFENSESDEDKEYYLELSEKISEASKLLIKQPVVLY